MNYNSTQFALCIIMVVYSYTVNAFRNLIMVLAIFAFLILPHCIFLIFL